MPACLSGENLSQSILLTLVCLFVHIQGHFPFDLHHVPRGIRRKRGVKAVEIGLSKPTLIDVPSKQDRAFPTGRRTQKNTWTRDITITGLKVGPGDFPGIRHKGDSVLGIEATASPPATASAVWLDCCLLPHGAGPDHRFLSRDRVLANRFGIPANRWLDAINNPGITPPFYDTVRHF